MPECYDRLGISGGKPMATKRRVLIVDDDPVSLEVARAVLEDLGYDVATRDRALGTSLALSRDRPDVVLIDVAMPGVTGDAIVRLGRSHPGLQDTVFILYSGVHTDDLARLASETGAAGAIHKSGNIEDFAREFQRIVASHAGDLPADG
jgi:adenylate cyclase